MTEKRFVSEDNCCGYYTEIIDNEKELDLSLYNPKKNLTIEELVDLLNQLNNENEQLKQSFINLIDKKIEEFKNGDYGDLPCNTIHMFLDLKQEIGDVE